MARRSKRNQQLLTLESAGVLIVFVRQPRNNASELPNSEYHRLFLQQKLIRGWLAIFKSIVVLGLLFGLLLDRIL